MATIVSKRLAAEACEQTLVALPQADAVICVAVHQATPSDAPVTAVRGVGVDMPPVRRAALLHFAIDALTAEHHRIMNGLTVVDAAADLRKANQEARRG